MSITSSNSVLLIGVNGLYTTPQQLQGFGEGDAYMMDVVNTTETRLGADGIMSAGWIPQIKILHVTLQADSASNSFFEAWYLAQESAREAYFAFGTIDQSSVGKIYTLSNGVLDGYTPIAEAKKVFEPRKFSIKFNTVLGSPV